MTGHLSNLHWISILIAFVVYAALGALWFTVFFSRQYKISLGRKDEVLQNKAPIFIVGPMICSLLIIIATAILINALQVHTIDGALFFAFVAGIGYLFANTVNIAINPNMPNPIRYGIITGTYHLAGMVIASIILTFIKW
ncbi:DUF1761 domain-containing protein [Terrimonas sp. NA20]|uniref:DUF1761 domain-containing protein n=1 Tax=Terrimonas ginsenosidimutans TaxID=2908004 RepID=A0ABS9KQQ7_9BACT|nr:DUF1761 domain-containing protein [Terrimonas ginsenosidimutans]MCG2614651.1 DUF1761 domain-containing protein [Terrimonas ginsenosidimutans]